LAGLAGWLACWLAGCLACWLAGWLGWAGWAGLAGWLVGCIAWLAGWQLALAVADWLSVRVAGQHHSTTAPQHHHTTTPPRRPHDNDRQTVTGGLVAGRPAPFCDSPDTTASKAGRPSNPTVRPALQPTSVASCHSSKLSPERHRGNKLAAPCSLRCLRTEQNRD